MGRVSSRYNYRLSKTKKTPKKTAKKLVTADKIVIRNKKTRTASKTQVKKSSAVQNKIRKSDSRLQKARRGTALKGGVTLDILRDYCSDKKVILVGNAGDIVSKPYGSKIDSYDIVIRMNHGHPLPKYIANMGEKYNIWSHGFLSHKRQITEYNKIKKKIDFHIETNEIKLCPRIFDKKAFLIPKKWYKTEYERGHKGKEMSTGLNTAFFFVNWVGTMSEIAIVGFDFLKTTNRVLHSASARKFHDTKAERAEMTSLLLESNKYIPFNQKYDFAK